MKLYQKTIDGEVVIKQLKHIVIYKDNNAIYNPSEAMALADGWVEYIQPLPEEPSEEDRFEDAKKMMIFQIEEYDKSESVNNCRISKDGVIMDYWADKHERDSLKNAVRDCISRGRDNYRLDLRELGVSLVIPCVSLLEILASLEVYAIDCYNKTTDHLYAVKAMAFGVQTIDDVERYDFHSGYPEMLTFNL